MAATTASLSADVTHNTQDLVQRAEHAIATLQPELALKFYERALASSPQDTTIMDALGELLLGLGDGERAFHLFEASATAAPESGASKWLYLGQLQEGWQALQHFSKAIEVLKAELGAGAQTHTQTQTQETNNNNDESFAIMNQIVGAQCSIAELYLTDLCFEDDAETRCQAALDEAVAMDVGGSPEVTQALANLRLSQQRGKEAAVLMLETVKRLDACQQDDDDDDEEDDEAEENQQQTKNNNTAGTTSPTPAAATTKLPLPSLMFRLQTAKLLLECQAYNKKCAKKAARILEQCKCEDDDNMEVWYLLGVAYFTQKVPDLEMSKAHLLYARETMKKQESLMRRGGGGGGEGGFPYQDHLRLVEEQLAMVEEVERSGVGACDKGREKKATAMEEEGEEDSSSSDSEESSEGEEEEEEEEDGVKMEN